MATVTLTAAGVGGTQSGTITTAGGSGGGKVIVATTAGSVVLTDQYCDAKSFKLITGLNNGATTLTVVSTAHGTSAQSGEIIYLTLVT